MVGVGHSPAARYISVRFAPLDRLPAHSLGVGHNPEPGAAVGGVEGTSRYFQNRDIVVERTEVVTDTSEVQVLLS